MPRLNATILAERMNTERAEYLDRIRLLEERVIALEAVLQHEANTAAAEASKPGTMRRAFTTMKEAKEAYFAAVKRGYKAVVSGNRDDGFTVTATKK